MIEVDSNSKTDFFEFLKYRQLIYYLTWRDLKVRYKQAVLGVVWTVLQPLIFSLIIGLIIVRRINVDFGFDGVSDLTLIVLSFSLWTFFEASFSGSAGSLLSNQGLLKKIYFPKTIPIISSVLTRLVDFLLALLVFIAFLIFSGSNFYLSGFIWLIPTTLVIALTTFFTGLILAPLNIRFRDVRFILPLITRVLFFSTPIWYPFAIIPAVLQPIFLFNPIVAGIELTRNAFFGPAGITIDQIVFPLITLLVLAIISIPIYKKQEAKLVDYV